MLQFIKDISHTLLDFIKDDPVRPEISTDFRVSNGRIVAALVEDNKPDAMVCISFHDFVPDSVASLSNFSIDPTTAVFYTIWSYAPGAGRELILDAVRHIRENKPNIKRFVTLSPPTEMARKFHIKNGANTFRINDSTINYEYI